MALGVLPGPPRLGVLLGPLGRLVCPVLGRLAAKLIFHIDRSVIRVIGSALSFRFFVSCAFLVVASYLILSYWSYLIFSRVTSVPGFWEAFVALFRFSYAIPSIISAFMSILITYYLIGKMGSYSKRILDTYDTMEEAARKSVPSYVDINSPGYSAALVREAHAKPFRRTRNRLFFALLLLLLLDIMGIVLGAGMFSLLHRTISVIEFYVSDREFLDVLMNKTGSETVIGFTMLATWRYFLLLPVNIAAVMNPTAL